MRRIVFLEPVSDEYIMRISAIIPDWEIINAWHNPEAMMLLKEAEVLGGWNKEAARLCFYDGTPLRWVHTWSAGVNGLPFEEFKRYNVLLTNSSGVHSVPISETLLAMMLAFTRKINIYIRNQTVKKWDRTYNGGELYGKTVGILGVGAIGLETARLAKAFGMKTLGFRYSGKPADYVDKMYGPGQLEVLLEQSDYVVNTLPLTKDTFHIIDEKCFKTMRRTSYYFNVGRGSTHDEMALIKALKEGWIAGAGLDVFEQEPLPIDSPLWEMDNVIIAPHTAGNNEHYLERVMDIFIPNLQAYISGRDQFINQVNLDRQY